MNGKHKLAFKKRTKTPLSNFAGVVRGRGFPFYRIIFFRNSSPTVQFQLQRGPFSSPWRTYDSTAHGLGANQRRSAHGSRKKRILDARDPRQTNRCSFLVQTFSRKRISSNYATKSPRPGWLLCAKKPACRFVLSVVFCHAQKGSGHYLSPGRGWRIVVMSQ